MKKLTTGIFTVLLGMVAVEANAAVTSKAYVDNKFDAVKATADANTTSITTLQTTVAGKADTSVTDGLTTRLTAAEGDIDGLQGTVGNETAGLVKDVADLQENMKNVATTEGLGELTKTVEGHTTSITTLNGNADTTGSVANSIKNALTTYSTTEQMNTAISNATSDKATTEALTTGLSGKQDKSKAAYSVGAADGTWQALTQTQIDALDSAITPAKVSIYDGYSAKITANETAAANAQTAAEAAQTTANAAIPKVNAEGGNGKYVLTATAVDGTATYAWEIIERAGEGSENAGQ